MAYTNLLFQIRRNFSRLLESKGFVHVSAGLKSNTSFNSFTGSVIGNVHFQRRTLFIQTEKTPNEHALKFIPGVSVLPQSGPQSKAIEFLNINEAKKYRSSLAISLFEIEGVESVFFGPDFISVNKKSSIEWKHVKPHVFATLMDWFSTRKDNVDPYTLPIDASNMQGSEPMSVSDTDVEVVQMIKELLDTRIRPSVQMDGGDIEFVKFTSDGYVQLRLRGACRSCSSSIVTLKQGIERMLMHYIPEVKGVEQVEDPLTDQGTKVFQEYEQSKDNR
jgi:Fe-S cluster biogenesis protein NfuA